MTRTLIFDTETTGLIDNTLIREQHQPRIIEFFGQVINGKGKPVEELEFLCDPGIQIQPIITKITGLTNVVLKQQEPFNKYADDVIKIIESCNRVVAHNMSYDHMITEFEMRRLGLEVGWPEMVCTVEQTEWFKGHRLNLQALHEFLFDKPFPDAHRARNDVEALTRCYVELVKRGDI